MVSSIKLTVVLPGHGQDPGLIIPSHIATAMRNLLQDLKHEAARRCTTRRARRAQGFLKGGPALVLVTALN